MFIGLDVAVIVAGGSRVIRFRFCFFRLTLEVLMDQDYVEGFVLRRHC